MRKFWQKIKSESLISTITGLAVLGTVLLANLAVFSRFANISLPATEELLRYVFVWIIMFCTALLYKEDGLISITILEEYIDKKGHTQVARIVRIFNIISVIIFAGFCVFYSGKIAWFQISSNKVSPVMEIPVFLVTLGMTIGSLLWLVIATKKAYRLLIER